MFCNKCGKELPDDAEFCVECGVRIVRREPGKAQIIKQKKEPAKPVKSVNRGLEKKNNGKKWWIFGGTVAVLAVVAVLLVVVLGGKEKLFGEQEELTEKRAKGTSEVQTGESGEAAKLSLCFREVIYKGGLPDVRVFLTSGYDNPDGKIVAEFTTLSDGTVQTELAAGEYTLCWEAGGYYSGHENLTVGGAEISVVKHMLPVLTEQKAYVLIEWDSDRDLDLCVFNAQTSQYINNKNVVDNTGDFLYYDNSGADGYELIYLSDYTAGIYTVYVRDGASLLQGTGSAMEAEGLTVSIYTADGLLYQEKANTAETAALWSPVYLYQGEAIEQEDYIYDMTNYAWAVVGTTVDSDVITTVDSDVITAAKMEAPIPSDDWEKIYCYSWNDEFGSRMQYVLDAHPEYADYVEFVNLGCFGTDGTYQTEIDTAMWTGDKYPSIIAMDNDVAKYYTETDNTLTMSAIGITNDMYANAYQYTVDYATYNGELKALTWQATPGCFIYRASIAEEVLGAKTPDEVQEYVKDWDTFFTTADTMKDAGYSMLSGPDDVKYAIWDQQKNPWITVAADGSEFLTLDAAVTEYFETAKRLYGGGYTNKTFMWSDRWSANFEGDVFGYFGCTWFVYWCINTQEDSATSTYGDWRVCQGPVDYHWGGTYVAVMKDCPNTELAAFLVYALCCDEDIMYTLGCDTLDFVNNKAVIEKEIANGDGASPLLGGQNPVEVWAEVAKGIDLSNSTYLDASLKAIMDRASESYNNGTYATVDEAIRYVKDEVACTYPYISVR